MPPCLEHAPLRKHTTQHHVRERLCKQHSRVNNHVAGGEVLLCEQQGCANPPRHRDVWQRSQQCSQQRSQQCSQQRSQQRSQQCSQQRSQQPSQQCSHHCHHIAFFKKKRLFLNAHDPVPNPLVFRSKVKNPGMTVVTLVFR